jgi:GalNAc-alpha-(1->4)-GalNAc-alpha-(1->3)-diNAcBac-PP-undecaprenol alpha-1,4-N-acetyl-D-galactosaminyltransferase
MILFVIYSLGRGGAERVVVRMANYWAEKGRDVGILTFDNTPPQYILNPKVRLIQAGIAAPSSNVISAVLNNIKKLRILRGWLKTLHPSAVISFIEEVNVAVSLASIGRSYKLILSDRIHPFWFGNRPIWQFLKRTSYRLADLLVVQTNDVKTAYKGFKVPITVINNPLNVANNPNIDYEKKAIIAVGRLDAQKNFPLLIRAFSRLNATDWSLQIFGEGQEKSNLNVLIAEKRLENQVILRGPTNDVFGEMSKASIFVLSSLAEGYPNVLIEAMSVGLAVVSTDCPSGPSEIIAFEENGLIVPNNDEKALANALQRLIDSVELREKLGREAIKIGDDLGIEKIIKQWENALEN